MNKLQKSSGFTIVELMIATLVFGIILLLSMAAFIHIGRLFYKSVVISRTEEVTRSVVDDLAGEIKRSTSPPEVGVMSGSPQISYICLRGQAEYFWVAMQQFSGDPDDTSNINRYGLRKLNNPDNCGVRSELPSGDKQLLGERMRVSEFSVTPCASVAPCLGKTNFIHLRISFGDGDVFTPNADLNSNPTCNGESTDSQFCVVTELNSAALRR